MQIRINLLPVPIPANVPYVVNESVPIQSQLLLGTLCHGQMLNIYGLEDHSHSTCIGIAVEKANISKYPRKRFRNRPNEQHEDLPGKYIRQIKARRNSIFSCHSNPEQFSFGHIPQKGPSRNVKQVDSTNIKCKK